MKVSAHPVLAPLALLAAWALAPASAPPGAPGAVQDAADEAPEAADPLAERARAICDQVVERPEVEPAPFHPRFLEAVPRLRMRAILRDYHEKVGAVEGLVPLGRDGRYLGRFLALGAAGSEFLVTIGVEPAPPHRISTLFFGPPAPSVTTWATWAEALAELPGETAFALCALGAEGDAEGAPRVLAARNPDEALAIGSAFKLWVLGALAREVAAGERSWADVAHLAEAGRSLPTGELQDWPVGAPVTLWTLAATMISKSDNTATDHLIRLLGRERVEAAMRAMGCAAPERNVPFLTTRELFLLKTAVGGAHAEAFLARDAAGRRAFLAETVAGLPLDAIDPVALTTPNRIDTLEWFASPLDLCRAMDDLQRLAERDEPLAGVLAINAGVNLGADLFDYLGFKGGSESGVINLTFLVRTRAGAWRALALTWNDPAAPVKDERFVGLARKALVLVALGERPPAPEDGAEDGAEPEHGADKEDGDR